jgi:hypothetical protein
MIMSLSDEQIQQKNAAIATDKQVMVVRAIAASTGLQQALTNASAIVGAMRARGYVLGSEDAIADADLIGQQFTAEEFHEAIELFGELQKFAGGAAVKAKPWALVNARVASIN